MAAGRQIGLGTEILAGFLIATSQTNKVGEQKRTSLTRRWSNPDSNLWFLSVELLFLAGTGTPE